MAQSENVPASAANPSSGRRTYHIVLAVFVGVVLPVILLEVFVGKFAADGLLLGLLMGVIGSMVGGTRRMLYLGVPFGVAAGLGAFTAYGWWWVALLALLGVIAGAAIGFGWLPSLLMLPFVATFASQLNSGPEAIAFGVFAALGLLYGLVLARRFKAPPVIDGHRVSLGMAVAVAVVLGLALGGTAAIGVILGWTEPYWVPEPVLILILYIIMGKRERVGQKALATAVGVGASVPVALLAPPTWAIVLLATTAFVLALSQYKKSYWLFYALYTFALVLVLSPPGQVGAEAVHRGSEILIGIGVLVVGLGVLDALSRWLTKHEPVPLLAPS